MLQQSIELLNHLNLAYSGPVYFGTPLQVPSRDSEFIYDTGSGYLTTTSTACSNCISKYYDPTVSSSARVYSSQTEKLDYGSASLTGYLGTDMVCLDTEEQVCVSNFEFFVIQSASGLNGNDGILGLSPPNESQNGPSYIKALYKQGTIDEEVATFWLNSYGEKNSFVTFGGKPENASKGESFKQDLVKRYDEWWTVNLHTVEYGGNDIKDSGIGYAILDTGTSLLYLGTEDYYNFADQMLS